ncbi:MAG: DUF3459 domain-containing protein, partial [Phaeodactylibacter sp.]|nr:DUF3459 domain-containing protein [Phaeodactylibacter sp.]
SAYPHIHPSAHQIYSVFLRSFYDSNADGIGDLRGLTQKLDYLQDLGVDGLWLLPIHPSPSYHKYDVRDYYGIDSIYGTKADFREFVAAAHARGMQVYLDLVLNHTDDEHPWFQAALLDSTSVFHDFYNWKAPAAIGEEQHLWHAQPADGALENNSSEYFYGFFWKGMPDLNLDNPAVRDSLIAWSKYWLDEMDVDGFRLDAALHIYPYYVQDRAANLEKTVAWWRQYAQALRAGHPDVFLVGEIWEGDSVIAPFLKAGLNAGFNFSLAQQLIQVLQAEQDTVGLVENLIRIQQRYTAQDADATDAIFLSNHDQNRLRSELGGSIEKAKLAASILWTLPGTPFIYYGEELGMLGQKPDERIREPFPWAASGQDSGQTTWEALEYNVPAQTPPLSMQQEDPNSIYQHYRNLIHLRKENPALHSGRLIARPAPAALLSYIRQSDDQQLLILHNLSAQPQPLPDGVE